MVTINKHQSQSLNALKVLMILFVIFIHENPEIETTGVFSMWIHQIVVVAVPVFFILSGFFFFKDVCLYTDLRGFMSVWKPKIKVRGRTLLIPYIAWNLLPVINICAGNLYSIIFRGKSMEALLKYWETLWDNGLWHIWWDKTSGTMPYDSPLWYVRDLIVINLLSPVLFYLIRKMQWMLAVVLCVVYVFGKWNGVTGLSITTITFFTIGASFALMGRFLTDIPFFLRNGCCIVALLSYFIVRVWGNSYAGALFIVSSSFLWLLIFDAVKGKFAKYLNKVSEGVFFTLALHNTCVLAIVGTFVNKMEVMPTWGMYLSIPFFTLVICMSLYFLLKRVCPLFINLLCGHRIK